VTRISLHASVARRPLRPFSVERYTALLKTENDTIEHAHTGPYFVAFPNLREALQNNTPIKTQARSCTILPNFVGCVDRMFHWVSNAPTVVENRTRFLVHNGKDYIPVQVTQDMVGHKLGEFSITKKRFTYKWVLLCL